MAEFNLNRFKYNWKGDWVTGTAYDRDDVVRYGAHSYVCLRSHTADSNFYTDLDAIVPGSNPPQPQPRWILMTASRSFVGSWQTSTFYRDDDVVLYDGSLYRCIEGHTSTDFYANESANWEIVAEHIKFKTDWASSTAYGNGAVVKYNGIVYRCTTSHQSQNKLEDDVDKWRIFHSGIEYTGVFTTPTTYRKNDLVKYGASIFRCNTTHDAINFDTTYWDLEFPGNQFDGIWSSGTEYQTGDIVDYKNDLYYALDVNTAIEPVNNAESATYWKYLTDSYNFVGDYTATEGTTYTKGDIVRRGGDLYRATTSHTIGPNDVADDGSSLDYLDTSGLWALVNPGKIWSNSWQINKLYFRNEIVYYFGTTYVSTRQHISSITNYPGVGAADGPDYWDTLAQAGVEAGLNQTGDILTYEINRYVEDESGNLTAIGDGSSFQPANLPIGNVDQVLSVNTDDRVYWRNFVQDAQVIYVSQNGTDTPTYGKDPSRPFKTLRYATQYVEDNMTGPVKIDVSAGNYTEILPMIIPTYCVVMGSELRSTTITANSAIPAYTDDVGYALSYLERFSEIIINLVQNADITPSVGNNISQVITETNASVNTGLAFQDLINDIKNKINFNVQGGSTDPTMTGSNTQASQDYLTAVANINANLEFLQQEAVSLIRQDFPDYEFDNDRMKNDVREFIRGITYDLSYSGNYKSLLAARYYSNAVNGSQLEDMFYLRDKTGLRQCTVQGLKGTLNPPGVFELYQRPTGGAYCSLDPGWGPDDDRTWIATRSPYIQGVTTIGSSCVGQKIDGSLHNGGNKSMTSNDFTQVLSDGVGAWVLNNGRAELVSVFTYYCQVGYLAEDGGIIRATNGNNSYGSFGAIADGIDPNEVPATGRVNNRLSEAVVDEAFCGVLGQDEILNFEYSHCGSNYTSASAEITGAGINEDVVYEDFRDNALFQARLIDPPDSGIAGGSGFTNTGGNAQGGNTTQITISANDENDEEDYIGLRIIITAGTGSGQYAKIASYNNVTKVIEVEKESDGTPGWDHVVAGRLIESTLFSNTVYRIEPRVYANSPTFTSFSYSLPSGSNNIVKDVVYGPHTKTYTGINFPSGTGSTNGVTATPAQFSVTKTGDVYSVVQTTTGFGYAVGDTATIEGTNFGGNTPDNDLTITVTSTTDDSSNAISAFSIQGTASTGKWIVIGGADQLTGNYFAHSNDGVTWTEGNLPVFGEWIKVEAGNNRFVAVRQDSDSTNNIAYSLDGENWNQADAPGGLWKDVVYGNGKFVAVAEFDQDVAYSTDGITWSLTSIPDNPGDSTEDQWQGVAFGANKFVAVSGSGASAVSTDGITWTRHDGSLGGDSTTGDIYDYAGVAFGNNRFVTIPKNGTTASYSFDGETWYASTINSEDGSTAFNWQDITYAQGVFVAVGDTGSRVIGADATSGPTNYYATSEDGILWTGRTFSDTTNWKAVAHGKINRSDNAWVAVASTGVKYNYITGGCTAKLRADIDGGKFTQVKIWDPGSGYNPSNFDITIVDNNFTLALYTEDRFGDGVLAQPSFINRGFGFRTSSTTVAISGDGFADIYPEANSVSIDGLTVVPGPGAQLLFEGLLDPDTVDPDDERIFTVQAITSQGQDDDGNLRATFRITPSFEIAYNISHNQNVSIRSNYSQCRITGHDFLDIGTGNFEATNYPDLYAEGNFFTAAPENEVREEDGGRVFYTSTDQDGNFRAGELFAVDQATGIVTISAEFFDLDGLSELSLGGVRLGGSGTVIREFSTDPTFAQDSNNVVPTQRAIATFLQNRLSEGGSELETNQLIAGLISIGGSDNEIGIVAGNSIQIPGKVDLNESVRGQLLAVNYMLRKPSGVV
jgi:hypothetical protein